MRAMVLAAGLGTRLRPLTHRRPKCLMPIMNRPLLGLCLERLGLWGIDFAVVNTHHLAPLVRTWLSRNRPPKMEVTESFEPQILGTGGALVKARDPLGKKPFVLLNADVLCTAELGPLQKAQAESKALAVLGLWDEPRFNTVAWGAAGRILGFKPELDQPGQAQWLTYSGLAVIHPGLLEYLPAKGYSSLVDGLKAALSDGREIKGVRLTGFWDDLGEPARLLALHRRLIHDPPAGLEHLHPDRPVVRDPGAYLDPEAEVSGFAVLGRGSRVEAGARLQDCLLLPGAVLKAGAVAQDAILGDNFVAQGEFRGKAYA